jgi:hypothetical protein
MTTIRRINVSQIDGNGANANDQNEIRPFGEASFYIDSNFNPNKLTLLMFDGERTHVKSKVLAPGVLYGSSADSGDGAGLDTIKLIPDASLYVLGSEQYLVIDPTEPDHIHIRAGGNIDDSSADLFLGGEKTHVRLSDNAGSVQIKTTSLSEEESSWSFIRSGEIYFPDLTVQATAWAGGRVVEAPLSSVGTEGDKQGDIAFTSDHLYYCVSDYTSNNVQYSTVLSNVTENDTQFIFSKDEGITEPDIGWIITVDPEGLNLTGNITNVEDLATDWRVTWDGDAVSANVGITVVLASSRTWKRVAWSNDIW